MRSRQVADLPRACPGQTSAEGPRPLSDHGEEESTHPGPLPGLLLHYVRPDSPAWVARTVPWAGQQGPGKLA